jgi:hypothetical protein
MAVVDAMTRLCSRMIALDCPLKATQVPNMKRGVAQEEQRVGEFEGYIDEMM